jgi:ubiquinone/menaquinone biosynthesis C-methylase UbiE
LLSSAGEGEHESSAVAERKRLTIDRERLSSEAYLPPWTHHEHQARYVFACSYVADAAVLDCACGAGIGSRLFAAAGARRVTGCDRSLAAIREARAAGGPPGLSYGVADATALPVGSASVEVVVSFETIEHLEDDLAYLREVSRVLSPAGVLLISTPNRRLKNPGRTITDRPVNPFHVREYAPDELSALVTPLFETVQSFGQNAYTPFLPVLLGFLGRLPGRHLAANLYKATKVPWYLRDRAARHAVVPQRPGRHYEYLVLVCRSPRSGARS